MKKGEQGAIFVIEIAGKGGIAHYTFNLLDHYKTNGRVRLYTGSPYELDGMSEAFEVRQVFRRYRTNPLRLVKLFIDVFLERPKVIHLQVSQAPVFILILMSVFSLARIPLVITAHNVVSHEEKRRERWVYSCIYRLSNRIISHSCYGASEISKRFGILPSRIRVIDHGNYMFFREFEAAGNHGKVTKEPGLDLLFFGYIREYKGLDVLLRALGRVPKELGIRCHIVGAAIESLDRYYELISELGLERVVKWNIGYLPLEEIAPTFELADVVVLPYKDIAQSGVLQLAYGFGKPVITSDVGGLPEGVEHERSGLIFPRADSGSLANCITRLATDSPLRESMGERAQELARTRFAWVDISPLNEAVYEEV